MYNAFPTVHVVEGPWRDDDGQMTYLCGLLDSVALRGF